MEKIHIGIILDGNRRFAKKLGKNPWEGHSAGAEKLEKLFNWIKEFPIRELTLYSFSIENFNRDKKEVAFLMKLFKKWFTKLEKDKSLKEKGIRIRFIGKRELFNKPLQKIMARIEEKTKDYNNYIINFALAYGGRQEILEAVKKLVQSKKEITEENFENCLWTKDQPDFIIRTGNEKRTSNFLPWQSVYSEWIFLEKTWPEFEKRDLKEAIEEFENRERRFGK